MKFFLIKKFILYFNYLIYLKIFKNHEKRLPALDALKDILGRSSMAVPRSKVVDAVFKHRLHTPEGMKELLSYTCFQLEEVMRQHEEGEQQLSEKVLSHLSATMQKKGC